MRKEGLARSMVVIGLAMALAIPLWGKWQTSRGVVIHARMAETGGWTPADLTVKAGEPLHLRLTSDDVAHSFAIGQSDQPAVDVLPGEMTDVTLRFSQPGKYVFYCTRWCGANHWRMRGTIQVTGTQAEPAAAQPPLYVALGLDIDQRQPAPVLPAQMPSAMRGALLVKAYPESGRDHAYYLTHSPVELYLELRADPALKRLTDQELWDMVAYTWQSSTTPAQVEQGRQLFSTNCAACHGEAGAGDGVYAQELSAKADEGSSGSVVGVQAQSPADFTDPSRMLSASPAVLQGKILRGGMGTGMPYWGPIFTEEQTWALIAYVWTFQFQTENNP